MIDIKVNFDSRKLERELHKQAESLALQETRRLLSDLIRKGLKVEVSNGKVKLVGEDDLLEEAKKRLK